MYTGYLEIELKLTLFVNSKPENPCHKHMRNLLFIFAFLIICGAGIYWNLCILKEKDCIINKSSDENDDLQNIYSLQVFDEENRVYDFDEGIWLKFGDTIPIFPQNNNNIIDSLADYLRNHDLKLLTISAFFEKSENNDLKLEWSGDVGKKRAQHIKDLIVERAVPDSRIIIETIAENLIFDDDMINYGGFELFFHTAKGKSDRPLTKYLYFSNDENDFYNDEALHSYTKNVLKFLNKYPKKEIEIKWLELNNDLGRTKAEKAKKYFINNGISSDKITLTSHSERKLAASFSNSEEQDTLHRLEIQLL